MSRTSGTRPSPSPLNLPQDLMHFKWIPSLARGDSCVSDLASYVAARLLKSCLAGKVMESVLFPHYLMPRKFGWWNQRDNECTECKGNGRLPYCAEDAALKKGQATAQQRK